MRFSKSSPLPREVLGAPLAVTAPNRRALFWKMVAGEWWKPRGPQGGEPAPDKGAAGVAPDDAQPYKPFADYEAFMPMQRNLQGLSIAYIDKVDRMPVTTYPVLMPRVERSGLQPFAARRTAFQTDVGPDMNGIHHAFPRQFNANTITDMRWRVGVPVPIGAGGGTGQTPSGARQPGYAYQRRALRVPRFSTIPVITDPRQA